MACSSCNKKKIYKSPLAEVKAQPKDCKYSEDFLRSLLSIARPPLRNYIQSQLNAYSYNCNLFQSKIDELVKDMEPSN